MSGAPSLVGAVVLIAGLGVAARLVVRVLVNPQALGLVDSATFGRAGPLATVGFCVGTIAFGDPPLPANDSRSVNVFEVELASDSPAD